MRRWNENSIDLNVAAGKLIEDFQPSFAARQLAQIPGVPRESVLVDARDGPHDLVVDLEVHAGLVFLAAAADQQIEIRPIDLKLGRGERALWAVAADAAVSRTGPLIAGEPVAS